MTKELVPEAQDFRGTKEVGRGFHRTWSVESSKTHNNPWAFILIVILMWIVYESGAAVETSSHPINGKHAERGRKGRLPIMDKFSCKAHNCVWLASNMRRPTQSDRAGAD
jgi:hypothetical protein